MTPDPHKIAKSLSEAQRRYLCDDIRSIGNPATWIVCGDSAFDARSSTLSVLLRNGIIEKTRFGLSLSDLGLAVRAILENDQ